MKTYNIFGLAKVGLLALFVALVPLTLSTAAQNTNGANTGSTNTGQTTAQPNANVNRPTESTTQPVNTNVNRPAATPRSEPTPRTIVREERGIDIPWGLLGLTGLLGLLRRPKRVVERVEVHDTKRVEVHDTTNQRNEPRR